MVKKKKIKRKKKDKFIEDILEKPLQNYSKETKLSFKDNLKEYGKNTLIILFVITFFTGGWFPFGLYDKYTISKDEANFEWSRALMPIISWCQNATEDKRVSFASFPNYKVKSEPGFSSEYYEKLSTNEKKCLLDENYRIFLINNDPSTINNNNLIKKHFNLLSNDIKNLKINSSKKLIELNNVVFNTNSNDWGYGWDKTFEDFVSMKKYDDEWDNSQWFCLENTLWCGSSTYGDKSNKFKLGFLSEKDFWQITMACHNGCIADIKYYTENGVNYIREYRIKEYILTELSNYKDKENTYVKEYNEIISKANDDIKIIREKLKENKKYAPPIWTTKIKL